MKQSLHIQKILFHPWSKSIHPQYIYKPGKDIYMILYYTCKKICPNIENTTRAHHRTCNTHKISGACKVNVHIFWAAKNIAYNTFRNFGTSDHLQTYRKWNTFQLFYELYREGNMKCKIFKILLLSYQHMPLVNERCCVKTYICFQGIVSNVKWSMQKTIYFE